MKTKHDFVRRYKASEFGNRAPTWDSLAEFVDSGYRGLVHIRNRVASAASWYNVPAEEVTKLWNQLITTGGYDAHNLFLSAMAPHAHNLIQGEVHRTTRGLDLFYSLLPDLPMREALSHDPRYGYGTQALMLLGYFMDSPSWEWFNHLLDAYPDHVIEFSTFGVNWGTIPKRNTVWWEVRQY